MVSRLRRRIDHGSARASRRPPWPSTEGYAVASGTHPRFGLTKCIATALVLASFSGLAAQSRDTLSASPSPAARDTTRSVSPTGALWRSMLVPGWGQALTGRHITGALFVTWEGVTMMMTLRALREEDYLSASTSANLASKRQQVQDWLVLWIFNHLFSGAEAFVSAHLIDFPKDWKVEALPRGVGVGVSLP